MEEKINAIEAIVNEINSRGSNYANKDVKDLFLRIFQVVGEVNVGAFELIYNYAIKDPLIGYQKNIENDQTLELFKKKIILDDIKIMDNIYLEKKDNIVQLTMNEKCVGGSEVAIVINIKTNSITVNSTTSNYLCRECEDDDEINFFVTQQFYVANETCYDYDFLKNDIVTIVNDDTVCTCYYDNDGIEIKKEIISNKNFLVENTINLITTFIEYYTEEIEDISQYIKALEDEEIPEEVKEYLMDKYSDKDLDDIDNYIDSVGSTIKKLQLIKKSLIKLYNELASIVKMKIYVRDDECFSKVNMFYKEIDNENKTLLKKNRKELYLPANGNLYELSHFVLKKEALSNYIKYFTDNVPKDDLARKSFQRILRDNKKEE